MVNSVKTLIRAMVRRRNPINWVDLRSTVPVSRVFGLDRGLPVDRYYLEKFLSEYKNTITGRVLEIGDDRYIKQFASEVDYSYILKYRVDEQKNTTLDDLTNLKSLPETKFDSIICVQTIHVIYDFRNALHGLNYLLKENGTLLVSLPAVSQVSVYDMEKYGDFWRFTTRAAETIFRDEFAGCDIKVHCYGNVLSCVSFIEGISAQELTKEELDFFDPSYPLLIGVAVRK